jgi:hypothetical protein
MEVDMKVNGRMIRKKEKDKNIIQMEVFLKVNGKMMRMERTIILFNRSIITYISLYVLIIIINVIKYFGFIISIHYFFNWAININFKV